MVGDFSRGRPLSVGPCVMIFLSARQISEFYIWTESSYHEESKGPICLMIRGLGKRRNYGSMDLAS